MEEILFYIVNENYINYLSKFEEKVSYSKKESGHTRPYLGIVLRVEEYEYFVPLYSYKEKYRKYKNNPSFFFVYDRKKTPLAIIRFSAMIPVPHSQVTELNYNEKDRKYKDLISAEYRYINLHKKEIYERANKIYKMVVKYENPFFKSISCDFTLLEKKCLIYIQKNQ